MLSIISVLFEMIWMIIKIPLFCVGLYFLCFFTACFIQGIAFLIQGKKLPRSLTLLFHRISSFLFISFSFNVYPPAVLNIE